MASAVSSFRPSKSNTPQLQPQHNFKTPGPSLSSSRVARAPPVDDIIHLSPDRKAAMLKLMEDSEHHVVNSMIGDPKSLTLWKPHMRKNGIAYYVDTNVAKGVNRFCCVGLTDASVPKIMEMFMVTNTETLLKNVRIMYRNVKEAKILSVLQRATRSSPNRSVYIRYACFDTPTLMNDRDICVCVCTNMMKVSDGSTVGYCLWGSVDIPECPDRSASDKIIRSKMSNSGFFFRNSGKPNALTKVCYIIGVEVGGVLAQLTGHIHMTIFGGNCRRLCKHYRKTALKPETFALSADWTPKHEVKDCFECGRRFNPLVKKYHCVKCGEVVCVRCFFMEEVSVRGAEIIQVRICNNCLEMAGMLGSNLQRIAARDSFDSLNSDGSGVRDLLRHDSESSKSSPYWVTP